MGQPSRKKPEPDERLARVVESFAFGAVDCDGYEQVVLWISTQIQGASLSD